MMFLEKKKDKGKNEKTKKKTIMSFEGPSFLLSPTPPPSSKERGEGFIRFFCVLGLLEKKGKGKVERVVWKIGFSNFSLPNFFSFSLFLFCFLSSFLFYWCWMEETLPDFQNLLADLASNHISLPICEYQPKQEENEPGSLGGGKIVLPYASRSLIEEVQQVFFFF